jgi:hypothetical protein
LVGRIEKWKDKKCREDGEDFSFSPWVFGTEDEKYNKIFCLVEKKIRKERKYSLSFTIMPLLHKK